MPKRIACHRPLGQAEAKKAYERAAPRQEDKNFYSSTRWVKFRRWFLSEHPLCQRCEAAGRVTLAVHVHHIKPRKDRPDLAFDEANCEALCQPCHNAEEIR